MLQEVFTSGAHRVKTDFLEKNVLTYYHIYYLNITNNLTMSSLSLDETRDITITFKGCSITLPETYFRTCGLITSAIEMDPNETVLSFDQFETTQEWLELLAQYLNMYKDAETHETIDKPLRSDKIEECGISEQLAAYLTGMYEKYGLDGLQTMVLLSNYLCCEPLLNAVCAKIACVVKAQVMQEFKETK